VLETLVSSRIRRALFEHLLTRPRDRFYLRGLAKDLNLSISPLRRELKRLERSGMLKAVQEGNMVFYAVEPTSPQFLQLQRAVRPEATAAGPATEAPSPLEPLALEAQGSGLRVAATPSPEPRAPSQAAIPVGVISAGHRLSAWRGPLSTPVLIGASGVGMTLVLLVTGLAYLTLTNQRSVSQALPAPVASDVVPTMRRATPDGAADAATSGVMQSSRWRVIPGGPTAFGAGTNMESLSR